MLGPQEVTSLASAFAYVGRSIDNTSMFIGIAWFSVAFGIWIGGWIVQFFVGWGLWKFLMLFDCRRCRKYTRRHSPPPSPTPTPPPPKRVNGNYDILQMVVDGGTRSMTQAEPIYGRPGPNGTMPRLVNQSRKIGNETSQSPYPPKSLAEQRIIQEGEREEKELRSQQGHMRSAYESFVRLAVITVRIMIVVGATLYALYIAGVNIYSVVTGFGLVSIGFSYAAAGIIANVFAAITIFSTYKLEVNDLIRYGHIFGEITAMRGQWIEVIDNFQPMQGRMVHHIANKDVLNGPVTIYLDGPPPAVIKEYYRQLKELEEMQNMKMPDIIVEK